MNSRLWTLFPLITLLILPVVASADFVTPIGVTTSSDFNASQTGVNTINWLDATGAPLSPPLTSSTQTYTSGGPNSLHWLSQRNDQNPNISSVAEEFIEWDLGAEYNLTDVYIWQYAFAGNNRYQRGVSQFDLVGAGADGVFDTNFLTDQALAAASDLAGQQGSETFSISGSGIQFVRLEVDSSWGVDQSGETRFVGLSEVRFEGTTAAVPEPSSSALLCLGLIGFVSRRRRG